MNTRNFKCFQIVYEERNLQAAAGKLFLSPQGVSKIIKSLEDEVGTPLFIRAKEGFVPTESGRVFYEKSKAVTRELNDLFTSIDAVNNQARRFKIGFAAGTIRVVDIPRIKEFMRNNVEIMAYWDEYETEKVLEQVKNDEIGFGFVVGEPNEKGIVSGLVETIDIVLYVYKGHPLWDVEQVHLEDLENEPLITMGENYRIYHDFIDACHVNDFNPNIISKVREGEAIYRLVKNGIGIGVSPRLFEDSEDIKAIPIKDAQNWKIYGVYREDSADVALANKLLGLMQNKK